MSLEQWQAALRRQFGSQQNFTLKNVGDEPIFSEFQVANPQSKNTYRVAIRGLQLGDNYCSCPDFATNTLGTCKHIEFTLSRLLRKSGAKRVFADGFQPSYSEVFIFYGAEREVRFRPGVDCPASLARLAANYFDATGRLKPAAFATFAAFLTAADKLGAEVRCYEDTLGFVAQVRDAERRRQLIAEAFPRGVRSAAFKNLLKLPLYDYQREGALFAAKAGRALLGDEMGLGKTFQAIATAEIMARLYGVERVLIVAPTSLKHQWEREIDKTTDRSVEVIGGLRPRRAEGFASDSFFKIMNYDTVHRDLDLIQGWSPELVILDEAQRIKNWETRAARSVKKIDSPYALVLTGTPLENRLEELVSIVQFVDRHRLGPTFRFLENHQIREPETGRVVGYRHLDEISRTLEPILLRRRKSEVLKQLPERLEKHFFVPMTEEQMAHHEENRETVARIVHRWRRHGFLSEADQRRLMISLQNMRMSCDSTYLLDKQTDRGPKADELATLLAELYEQPNSKVVIFSQWLRMHELLIRRFDDRGWNQVLFHGGVDGGKRKQLIDRFREDPDCRAFLSTDAGGVGLNLQHANIVVNVDLPWNPAVLEQRIGRVHRLGQTQPVQVINFVSQGTIEEGMLSLLGFKKSLFSGVLDGGEREVFLGGSRLKRFLESVETVTARIPEAVADDPQAGQFSDMADGGAADQVGPVDAAPASLSNERVTAAAASVAEGDVEIVAADPWTGLLQQGLSLLANLSQQSGAGSQPSGNGNAKSNNSLAAGINRLIQTAQDDRTGEQYLRLPMPTPQVIQAVARSLEGILRQFQR